VDDARVVHVPRWGGTCDDDWYPWMRARLAAAGREAACAPLAPEPSAPAVAETVLSIRAALADDPAALARTVLVGHSIGCRAILHALASLPRSVGVRGLLLVAAWWWSDRTWATLMPWLATPPDAVRARERAGRVLVVISDDDPYTADWRRNRAAWEERMGAEVRLARGAGHLTRAEEPAVAEALDDLLSPPAGA
jgi:predicted alpha/beta hydrolase family esterase